MTGSAGRRQRRWRLRALALVGAVWVCAAAGHATEASLPATVELRQVGEMMVPFQSDLPIPTYDPQLRPHIDLSDGWRRWRTNLDHGLSLSARTPGNLASLEREGRGAHRLDYDDRTWEMARLPEMANPPPYPGPSGVWYRRKVSIAPVWKEQRVLFHCLAANYVADLWVNGRYVGYHEGGCTPFSFDITDQVRWGNANTIALRVDNPPWALATAAGSLSKEMVPAGPGDWWNATGVLRDIYLEAVPSAWLVRADVRSEASEQGTRLRVQVVLRHAGASVFTGQVTAQVSPALVAEANLTTPAADGLLGNRPAAPVVDGRPEMHVVVAPKVVLACVLDFTTVPLQTWSPAEPNLHILEVLLRDEQGRLVDRLAVQFGVRTLTADREQARILLNGKAVRLRGVARVEDDPQFGRAVTFGDGLRVLLDLRTAKWAGAELLHLGHLVNHPITTLLADRMGLICWEEIPAYRLDEQALSTQWERRRIARQMLIEMIYQDYNRPSVGFWGVCDDPAPLAGQEGGSAGQFTRDLSDIARYLDGSRLVAESGSPARVSQRGSECDVQGIALPLLSHGDEAMGQDLASLLARIHTSHPGQPLLITEFSVAPGEDVPSAQRQAGTARELVETFSSLPYVAGWVWWALADYQEAAGIRHTGLMSRDRRVTRAVSAGLQEAYRGVRPGVRGAPLRTTARSR